MDETLDEIRNELQQIKYLQERIHNMVSSIKNQETCKEIPVNINLSDYNATMNFPLSSTLDNVSKKIERHLQDAIRDKKIDVGIEYDEYPEEPTDYPKPSLEKCMRDVRHHQSRLFRLFFALFIIGFIFFVLSIIYNPFIYIGIGSVVFSLFGMIYLWTREFFRLSIKHKESIQNIENFKIKLRDYTNYIKNFHDRFDDEIRKASQHVIDSINQYKEKERRIAIETENEVNDLMNRLSELRSSSLIPYQYTEDIQACTDLLGIIDSRRADSLKELLNCYEWDKNTGRIIQKLNESAKIHYENILS
jgi:gas vesicle protein